MPQEPSLRPLNIVLFGASGMVGGGVLLHLLDDPDVASVLSVGRRPSGLNHPKLSELLRTDFFDYSDAKERLRGFDACFFTLGRSSVGLSEAEYTRDTFDLTLAAAKTLIELNPGMSFCYVSGKGTDNSEKGKIMWARVKGRTENA
ncbi:MAG: epimerase, partial [bacterium]